MLDSFCILSIICFHLFCCKNTNSDSSQEIAVVLSACCQLLVRQIGTDANHLKIDSWKHLPFTRYWAQHELQGNMSYLYVFSCVQCMACLVKTCLFGSLDIFMANIIFIPHCWYTARPPCWYGFLFYLVETWFSYIIYLKTRSLLLLKSSV